EMRIARPGTLPVAGLAGNLPVRPARRLVVSPCHEPPRHPVGVAGLPGLGRQLPGLGPGAAGDAAVAVQRPAPGPAGGVAAGLPAPAGTRAVAAPAGDRPVRRRAAFQPRLLVVEAGRQPLGA